MVKAWHFTNGSLRDGRPIPKAGETLRHDGELIMCKSGLHASRRLIDALDYAPGLTLHCVELAGKVLHEDDKSVAMERTILWTLPESVMEPLLRDFARRCALDVIHLWDAPEVVVTYLKAGDESLRAAAREAAWAAAGATARAAAGAAARAAARAAAGDAAWAAAGDAARERQNRRLTSMVAAARTRP
jgi:hypothetical protein